jgi:NADH-quinone oxidoreductase subunit N
VTLAEYIVHLAPEATLLIGGCATLAAGLSRRPAGGSFPAWTALATVILALWFTWQSDSSPDTFASIGLWLTPVASFVRWITLGLAVMILLINWTQPDHGEGGEYFAMILFSLLGVLLTALANDWVILFLALELVSIPTYVLVALSRQDARATEAGLKYFFLGAFAAALLAYGVSFLYGATGTTAMNRWIDGTAAAMPLGGQTLSGYFLIGLLLVLAGLSFKIAAIPFHAYAPDVYEGAASPVTGLLGFVPKFAGFVALVKVMTEIQWQMPPTLFWLLWIMAALTMTAGNVLALLQHNVKRMLAYSSIAHSGYMLIALLAGPALGAGPMRNGVAALFFYVTVYGAMNLGAFALLSAFKKQGRPLETLDDLAGIAAASPAAALAFAVCIFSLMGFPPTAGFLAKLFVFGSALSVPSEHPYRVALIVLAVVGALNSAVAATYYLRIIAAAYWDREDVRPAPVRGTPALWGMALCTVPLIALFFWPTGLLNSARAASASVNPAGVAAPPTRLAGDSGMVGPPVRPAKPVPPESPAQSDFKE